MPTFIRSIWVTGGEGRGAKVTRRWAGTTRLIYCPHVCPASRVPGPVSPVLLPPPFAAGCTPMPMLMYMLMVMVSCRRNGRKGRKSGFCVRNDFCAPHLNEGKLKWIPPAVGDEFKSTSSARIDFCSSSVPVRCTGSN